MRCYSLQLAFVLGTVLLLLLLLGMAVVRDGQLVATDDQRHVGVIITHQQPTTTRPQGDGTAAMATTATASATFQPLLPDARVPNANDPSRTDHATVPVIFIAAFSPVEAPQLRALMRETWLTQHDVKVGRMGIAYRHFIARPGSPAVAQAIQQEQAAYGDLVVLDLSSDSESEFNQLLRKEAMAFRWACKHFSHAAILFKADPDAFVNLPNIVYHQLLPMLRQHGTTKPIYIGNLVDGTRPRREHSVKFWVSPADYPLHLYPPFMQGGFFGMTLPLACPASDLVLNEPCMDHKNGLDDSGWGIAVEALRTLRNINTTIASMLHWNGHIHWNLINKPFPKHVYFLHKIQGEMTFRLLHKYVVQRIANGLMPLPVRKCPLPSDNEILATALPPIIIFIDPAEKNLEQSNGADIANQTMVPTSLCWSHTPEKVLMADARPVPKHPVHVFPDHCYTTNPTYGKGTRKCNRWYLDVFANHTVIKPFRPKGGIVPPEWDQDPS